MAKKSKQEVASDVVETVKGGKAMAKKNKKVVAEVETVVEQVSANDGVNVAEVSEVVSNGEVIEMAKNNDVVEVAAFVSGEAALDAAELALEAASIEAGEAFDSDEASGEHEVSDDFGDDSEGGKRGRKGGNFSVKTYFLLRDSGLEEGEIRLAVENDDDELNLALIKRAKDFARAQEGSEPGKRGRKVSQGVIDILAANGFTLDELSKMDEKKQRKLMNSAREMAKAVRLGFKFGVA